MKKIVLSTLISLVVFPVFSQENNDSNGLILGLSAINISQEQYGVDVDLSGMMVSIGYKVKTSDNFYLIPELNIGGGTSGDSFSLNHSNIRVDLDSFLAVSIKGQLEFDNGVYVFIAPTYVNAEFSASVSNVLTKVSVTNDSYEFGAGFGCGYKFNELLSLEASYYDFGDVDMRSIGIKRRF